MGKNQPSDSSSSGSNGSSGNPLRGLFTSIADNVFKALPIAVDSYVKQRMKNVRNKMEEKMERMALSDRPTRFPNPYRRKRKHVAFDDKVAYRPSWQGKENLADRGFETYEPFRDRWQDTQRGTAGRTRTPRRIHFETSERRKRSLVQRSRHHFDRRISHRHSPSSRPRNFSKSKDETTLKVTLPFSNEVMHAGAVGIIAGATTAFRLRSSDTEWLGEKGVRAGSSAAAAAVASLVVGRDGQTDMIREVGLPVILGIGVDHMLWE